MVDHRALVRAVELVRGAYGDAMDAAGLIKGVQVQVHAYADRFLAEVLALPDREDP